MTRKMKKKMSKDTEWQPSLMWMNILGVPPLEDEEDDE